MMNTMNTTDTLTLWKHQREAVDFAKENRATMLNMGLGTGKSACAIQLARELMDEGPSFGAKAPQDMKLLILCPLSVCDAWRDQLAKFGPEFETVILNKGSVRKKHAEAEKAVRRAKANNVPVAVVINYESARNNPFAEWALKPKMWDLLVMDESHRLKSHKGKTSKFVRRLAHQRCSNRKLALTGTPLPHSPLDIWAQYACLAPDIFGRSFFMFRKEYAVFGGYQCREVKSYQRLPMMQRLMGKIMYQCDRSVIELTEVTHQKRIVDLSPEAKRIYASLEDDFYAQVKGGEVSCSNALVKLLRLSQTTSGRVSVENDEGESTLVEVDKAKEKGLVDLLTDVWGGEASSLPDSLFTTPDEPVVVFGRFKSDLLSVHAAAEALGRKSLELSGSRRELKEWQRGDAPILACQIQSGSTGIDLTRAAVVCYLSVGYSLGDYEQSLARSSRPGQTRPVSYYHFVARDTVDEKVYTALQSRKQVVETILDGINQDN